MIEFHFFGMPIKTLGSLGKIRVGRVTGNMHIFFWPKGRVEIIPSYSNDYMPNQKQSSLSITISKIC